MTTLCEKCFHGNLCVHRCIMGKEDEKTLICCENFMPAADVVEVVRCKDCKHKVVTDEGEYDPHDIVCDYHDSDGFDETDYCSYGERR